MNKVIATEINGIKIIKLRIRTPKPKVFKDATKYNRKQKYKKHLDN